MASYILITLSKSADADEVWRKVSNVEGVTVADDTPHGYDWGMVAKLFVSRRRLQKANSEIRKIPGVLSTAMAIRRAVRGKASSV